MVSTSLYTSLIPAVSPVLKDVHVAAWLGQTMRARGQALPYGLAQLRGRRTRQREAAMLRVWGQL